MYGTAEISQVLLNCTLAMEAMPAARARSQFRVDRGPTSATFIIYSPPPGSLSTRVSLGKSGISFSESASPQAQSHAITSAVALCRRTPSRNVPTTSAITSQLLRCEHRGHLGALGAFWPHPSPFEKQLVRFSDMVMQKIPPRSGACRTTWA